MPASIFIIVLNYNGYSDTLECVRSLQAAIRPEEVDYQIIVIDNHSTDDSWDILQNELPEGVTLLKSYKNAGYAYGNNIGIQYAVENGAEYICILNNDTIVTEDFLTPCINEIKNQANIAFISPMLMNYKDGLVQNTGASLSIIKGKTSEKNKNVSVELIHESIIECDIVYGATMIFRTDLIKKIGLLPENYFLFYEETEWCYKAKKAGFINCINSRTKIIHKGSQSLKEMSKMQQYLMERNRTLFVKRNGTRPQFVSFLFYDFLRTVYRALFHGVPLAKYIKYHYDGIVERFDLELVNSIEL